MLIPLSDPIWKRLYGPYGVQNVATDIGSLQKRWDHSLAENLFWEKLYHQETLYPVSFAALPWLWEIITNSKAPDCHALDFFSHFVYCAFGYDASGSKDPCSRPIQQGLSLNVQDHKWKWIPEASHLHQEDMETLSALENWFFQTAPHISEACFQAIQQNDNGMAAALLQSILILKGNNNLSVIVTLWADGHDMDFIRNTDNFKLLNNTICEEFSIKLANRNSDLSKFLAILADAVQKNR